MTCHSSWLALQLFSWIKPLAALEVSSKGMCRDLVHSEEHRLERTSQFATAPGFALLHESSHFADIQSSPFSSFHLLM